MLTVLGGLPEFERELIRARAGEGRELAKARGVKVGRRREAIKWYDAGEPMRETARTYNVSRSTVSRPAPGSFVAFGAKD
jgi:DNA invertase Pin-like site-specific DNA recombinase